MIDKLVAECRDALENLDDYMRVRRAEEAREWALNLADRARDVARHLQERDEALEDEARFMSLDLPSD